MLHALVIDEVSTNSTYTSCTNQQTGSVLPWPKEGEDTKLEQAKWLNALDSSWTWERVGCVCVKKAGNPKTETHTHNHITRVLCDWWDLTGCCY